MFLDSLAKISVVEAEKIGLKIRRFRDYISKVKKEDLTGDFLSQTNYGAVLDGKKAHDSKRSVKASSNVRKMLLDAFLLFGIVLIYAALMLINYILVQNFKKKTLFFANRIVFAISDLANLGIATTSVYEYIDMNRTSKIFNKPLIESIDQIITKIDNVNEFFTTYSDDGSSLVPGYLDELTGPLCRYMSARNAPFCFIDKNMTSSGIIGMKSFYYIALSSVKK
jgi:hypothetical protein